MCNKVFFLIVIFAGVVFLAGCSSSTNKKTEINLPQNSQENVSESAPEENNEAELNAENSSEEKADSSQEKVAQENKDAAPEMAEDKKVEEDVPAAVIFSIKDRLVGWGFTKTSGRTIDTIVMHSSYNAVGSDLHDLDDIINKEYKPAGVSPHYIIDRKGQVYRLVKDENIAYHAGVSKVPDGRENVNNFSIGIEIVNTKSESPNSAQYASVKKLISYLKGKYKIKYVLGHSDIASGRKDDPWNFDWKKLK